MLLGIDSRKVMTLLNHISDCSMSCLLVNGVPNGKGFRSSFPIRNTIIRTGNVGMYWYLENLDSRVDRPEGLQGNMTMQDYCEKGHVDDVLRTMGFFGKSTYLFEYFDTIMFYWYPSPMFSCTIWQHSLSS